MKTVKYGLGPAIKVPDGEIVKVTGDPYYGEVYLRAIPERSAYKCDKCYMHGKECLKYPILCSNIYLEQVFAEDLI